MEDVLNDWLKDHDCKSYHISMVEKVIKGFKYDEFIIEFQNDNKPVNPNVRRYGLKKKHELDFFYAFLSV